MSVLRGEITAVEDKTSKKGKSYQRLNITNEAGTRAWWTSFAGTQGREGMRITAEVKPMGDGEIISDFVADSNGAQVSHVDPHAAPVARQESTSKGATSSQDDWHVKDLNIAAQSAFKAICGSGVTLGNEADLMKAAKVAMEISIYWDKKARATVAGADIGAMKEALQHEDVPQQNQASMGSPPTDSQAQDLSNQALSDDGFDQSIPF